LKDIHYKCSKDDERYLNHHQLEIKSGTLSKTKSGNYYFSVLIDRPNKILKDAKNDVMGIDLGIKDFIVTSNGEWFENIKIKRNNTKKLKRLNQLLSRKQKKGKNKEKSRIKLSKFHEKLNNIKNYYLHSVSNQLLNENQVIVIENLNVNGMMKNHRLAKSIQELSLNEFKTMLMYKANWSDREIIQVDQWFPSSKLCSVCNYKNTDLTLKDRSWVCPNCKTNHDRDLNAAVNIRNEGMKIKIGLSSPKLKPLESRSLDHSLN
jgi:putative transposase